MAIMASISALDIVGCWAIRSATMLAARPTFLLASMASEISIDAR